jgi:hypothetical protein
LGGNDTKDLESYPAAAGTIVYNDGKGSVSKAGIYLWDGDKWLSVKASGNGDDDDDDDDGNHNWTGSTLSNAAKDYSITPTTDNSAGTDGSMAKGWASAANDAGSGNYWATYPATGNTPSSGGKNLMVSNKVYSLSHEVSSPNASDDIRYSAVDLSSLGGGMMWADAVKRCADLIEGDYDDWYLPNSMELDVLHENGFLGYTQGGGIAGFWYWSSTEKSASEAFLRSYVSNNATTGAPAKTWTVAGNTRTLARCVRRTNLSD